MQADLSAERCVTRGMGPTGIADMFALRRAGCDPLRRQQQRRASLLYKAGLTAEEVMRYALVPLGVVIGDEKGHAEPGDIEGSSVIPCPIPQALGIRTTQPGSPVDGLCADRLEQRRHRFWPGW